MARRPSDVQYLGCHVIKRGCGGGDIPPRRRAIGETARHNSENFPLSKRNVKAERVTNGLLADAKARRKANSEAAKAAHKKWLAQQVIDMICAAHDAAPDYILQRIHDDTTELSR